jgi:hypothetical protein
MGGFDSIAPYVCVRSGCCGACVRFWWCGCTWSEFGAEDVGFGWSGDGCEEKMNEVRGDGCGYF